MHMRGTPETMQQLTQYEDTCREVGQELQQQAQKAIDAGIQPWRIILDPGRNCVHTVLRIACTCLNTPRLLEHPAYNVNRDSLTSGVCLVSSSNSAIITAAPAAWQA